MLYCYGVFFGGLRTREITQAQGSPARVFLQRRSQATLATDSCQALEETCLEAGGATKFILIRFLLFPFLTMCVTT